jgi:outer membrane immunogenic protein
MIVKATAKAALLASLGLVLAALPAHVSAQSGQDGEYEDRGDSGSWTGAYVGARLGYAFQKNDDDETVGFDTNLDGNFNDTVTTGTGANAFSTGFCGGRALGSVNRGCGDDRDGTDYAVQAGFDYQIGSIVVGIVGDYGRTNVRDDVSAFSTTPAFYTLTRRLRDNASIRARAGFALGDTLVYGTGGLAYGKIRNSFTTSNMANQFTDTGNDKAYGYRVGGGLEHRFGRNFSLGVQYLYTSLKDEDFRVRAGGPAPAGNPFLRTNPLGTDFARSGDRFNMHSVQVGANFRF